MARPQATFQELKQAGLDEIDPEIARLIGDELERQRGQIELIASENFTWPAVLEAIGSVPTNKYAEGYPGRRYYGGCEVIDEIEQLAIDRAKELFGAEHANVQPHAGAQTNMAVYLAWAPGERSSALALNQGGHLTHGHKVNFSGRLYNVAHYEVSRETMTVDYDDVLAKAKEGAAQGDRLRRVAIPGRSKPSRFRAIADEVGAMLVCDMAHFAGLVAAGLQPNPVGALRLRDLDDAQDARRPARRLHPLPRGAREGARPRRDARDAGWAARAHDRGEGDVLPDRDDRRFPRVPGADPPQRRRAGRDAARRRARLVTGGTDRTSCSSTWRVGVDGQGGRGAVARDASHRQPQHDPVRRAVAVRHLRDPPRLAGHDHARLRRGRLPRGGADHLRGAHRGRRTSTALRARVATLCAKRPLYEGFRGYTTYVA